MSGLAEPGDEDAFSFWSNVVNKRFVRSYMPGLIEPQDKDVFSF